MPWPSTRPLGGTHRQGALWREARRGQVAPAHPRVIVDDGECRQGGIGPEVDGGRPRVEGVGHDLGHDRLLEAAGIGVPDVLQEMLQIDPCLAQGLSR